MSDERPGFLDHGVFEWDALGYHLSAKPSIDLMLPAALDHTNPWFVLAAVLARAKHGRFEELPRLMDRIDRHRELTFWRACFDLLGDAGSSLVQRQLIDRCEENLFVNKDLAYQTHVPKSLSCSMLLWTAPEMMEIYLASRARKETGFITVFLSRLLEPQFGPIALATAPDDQYREIVINSCKRLADQLGTDQCPILYGQRFSIVGLAKRLHDSLKSSEATPTTIMRDRHIFEAQTGIDCSSFYDEEELQPLTATAVLEEFLDGPDIENYEDGVRYFFGHRIPD